MTLAALFMTVLLALTVLGACGGEAEEPIATVPTASSVAAAGAMEQSPTTTSGAVAKTTTTFLSLNDRVQQEQAEREAAAAATSTTTAPSSAAASTTASASGSGKTLVLSDGSRLTSVEADAAYAYEPLGIGFQQKQERLVDNFERFKARFGQWSPTDYTQFKSLVDDQKALVKELQAVKGKWPYVDSHQQRFLAAQSFLSGWQSVLDGDAGTSPATAGVAKGMRDHDFGVDGLASAQSQFESARNLFEGAYWE